MKKALFPVILTAVFLAPQAADAVYVTVDTAPQQYRNQPIRLGQHKVVGRVGDYFELRDGTHSLRIDAPRNHYVQMEVDVRGDNLEIRIEQEKSVYGHGCEDRWVTEWIGQLKKEQTRIRQGTLWVISLPEIGFTRAAGEGVCASAVGVSCDRIGFYVTVSTQPENAEIWIDGEVSNQRTPTGRLKFSACQSDESVQVLTRTEGYIPCKEEFEIYHDADIVFSCSMERIH